MLTVANMTTMVDMPDADNADYDRRHARSMKTFMMRDGHAKITIMADHQTGNNVGTPADYCDANG